MITPDRIVRSNRKTLSVSVNPLGVVTVRAPKAMREERIFAFLKEKESWILKQKDKFERAGIRLPSEDLNGYEFLLLGERYTICLYEGKIIRLDKPTGRLFVPEKNAEKRLTAWLKENALRIFTAETQKRAEEMGVRAKSVAVSSARTRWGSCSGTNDIRYTYRLLYAPKAVVEYVIVHELAHIRHKNHGKRFWALVESHIPDYKQRRRWLKEHGALMEIF